MRGYMNEKKSSSLFDICKEKLSEGYKIDLESSEIINELRIIYDRVVSNYVKLNNDFDLTDPLEVYSLFSILLTNKYLSRKSRFYDCNRSEEILDIIIFDDLEGVNVLTGICECRHVSKIYSDILNKLDINNEIYSAYLYNPKDRFVFLKILKTCIQTLNMIDVNDALSISNIDRIANHTINKVYYNNISYFFDPIKDFVLLLDPYKRNKLRYNDHVMALIREQPSEEIVFDSLSLYKEKKKKVLDIIDNNYKMVESFYDNNKENYREVEKKVKILSKKSKNKVL